MTTTEVSEIRFAVEPWVPTGTLLTPLVDGRSFVELVTEYEECHGWDNAYQLLGSVPPPPRRLHQTEILSLAIRPRRGTSETGRGDDNS